MNQYRLQSGLRTTLLAMIAIGLISMVITFIGDDAHHTRFWSNILHNSVYFTGNRDTCILYVECAHHRLVWLECGFQACVGGFCHVSHPRAYPNADHRSRYLGWMASPVSLG